ncbi:MAG: hypothetical protein NT069_24285 [Planctomycetota bacterium]|nr:hypothetical protein [Planctomycetota bacterium]
MSDGGGRGRWNRDQMVLVSLVAVAVSFVLYLEYWLPKRLAEMTVLDSTVHLQGEAARTFILDQTDIDRRRDLSELCLLETCRAFDGGNFNGSIEYWSCQCRSLDAAWSLVEAWSGLSRTQFDDFRPSEYACVMEGPNRQSADWWKVARIERGAVFQKNRRDRQLWFYAIDFDRLVVYGAYESGGFPQKKWGQTDVEGNGR